ncbi:PSP1 domain-containing protein [Mariniblastus fucicola]|uniref:PSP1 domain-containing protein n=1 Tax=Mariniblastus fucicola TaxID=980251 RepID=UPI001EE463DC|nr:regulatory iron-sulfur-containing complex subunit RicT [Mariniblastus fucicola]
MPSYIVRYGSMRNLGVMQAGSTDSYRRGQEVIVKTDRGTESGQVLCEASDDALSHLDDPPSGRILREFGDQDADDLAANEAGRAKLMKDVEKQIEKLGLVMQLVDVEQILGRQRVVIYYLAEARVDFRELVKLLAAMLSTRIEMRQIGVRDEAKLLADYGDCGKPVCCNTHLVKMPPVSMKMAKLQKATLDPTKISGRCGRLKCCLRYEFETYDEIQKSMPNVGWRIVTRQGKAKVIAQQILAEQLLIETEDHRRMLIDASEVLSVLEKTSPAKPKKKKKKKPKPKPKN